MLERLGGALHAALQFVDVETTRGHNALLPENSPSGPSSRPPAVHLSSPDDGAVARAAQDFTFLTRLGGLKNNDRQRSLCRQNHSSRYHVPVPTLHPHPSLQC